jgi:hypothetical protein
MGALDSCGTGQGPVARSREHGKNLWDPPLYAKRMLSICWLLVGEATDTRLTHCSEQHVV